MIRKTLLAVSAAALFATSLNASAAE